MRWAAGVLIQRRVYLTKTLEGPGWLDVQSDDRKEKWTYVES